MATAVLIASRQLHQVVNAVEPLKRRVTQAEALKYNHEIALQTLCERANLAGSGKCDSAFHV
jgi:hypothetical protein